MNNKIKLDTTMLQSNTAMHLIAFIIEQRDIILKLLGNEDVKIKDLKELTENTEYILKKHTNALHKRCGTRIFGVKTDREEDLYDNSLPEPK
tara:strand:- start:108 stop:383 length:276 start_codon:yes stop_codon:yes gene_type:complete